MVLEYGKTIFLDNAPPLFCNLHIHMPYPPKATMRPRSFVPSPSHNDSNPKSQLYYILEVRVITQCRVPANTLAGLNGSHLKATQSHVQGLYGHPVGYNIPHL